MTKLYGSLNNRLDENKYYNGTQNNLAVGTLATIYYYSDRHAYEVVEVKDQKHIKIRQLDAKRIDNNGMSDCQSYEYTSNKNNRIIELELTRYGWKQVTRYNLDLYNNIKNRLGYVLWTSDIVEKVMQGKEVKRTNKISISFGIAEEHYDYSF